MKYLLSISLFLVYGFLNSQNIKEKLPNFPNYFNQVSDTINVYVSGANSSQKIKHVKKDVIIEEQIYIDYEKFFNQQGVEITKEGKPISKSIILNDSIKHKKVYFLDGYPDASTRVLDPDDYYLAHEIIYGRDDKIYKVIKYNANGTKDVLSYKYYNNLRLIEIEEQLFWGTSETYSDSGDPILYLQQDPTIINTTNAVYNEESLMKIITTEVSRDTNLGHYTKTSKQKISYNKSGNPMKIIEEVELVDNRSDPDKSQVIIKDLTIDYNAEDRIENTQVSIRNNTEEVEGSQSYFSYTHNRLKNLNILKHGLITEQQDYSFIYDDKGNLLEVKVDKQNDRQTSKEKVVYTFQYY